MSYYVAVDLTDEFLDNLDEVGQYHYEDGTIGPLFTPDELERLGKLYPDSKIKVPPSPECSANVE